MLKPLSVIKLGKVLLDLVENEHLEIKLSHSILIELLLFLALDVLASKNVQILLIGILQLPVVSFDSQVGLHYLLEICLKDLLLLLNGSWSCGECFLFVRRAAIGATTHLRRTSSGFRKRNFHALNHIQFNR